MKTIILSVSLYTLTEQKDIFLCPWRQYLASTGLEWQDLNYEGVKDNLNPCLDPLNTWTFENFKEDLKPEHFPFAIISSVSYTESGAAPQLVHLFTDLDELKNSNMLTPNTE